MISYSPDQREQMVRYITASMVTSPGAVIVTQTFGDFLRFNPHGHVLNTDGCFFEF